VSSKYVNFVGGVYKIAEMLDNQMVFLRLTQLKTAISELLMAIANEVFMPKVNQA